MASAFYAMDSVNTKQTSARAFIRSLNILLKYARLYSFDHARTMEQFHTAWDELHAAIPITNESGLLLSATGSQLLLDGVPIDASPAERSFAQLLSAAGLASIQFTSRVTEGDLERLARAFPTSNIKPSVLAEKLKAALTGSNIRINEVRFVAEDSSKSETLAAGLLTAQSLGADTEAVKNWIKDPEKLLQLIAAAEGSRGSAGEVPGDGPGDGKVAGASGAGLDAAGGTAAASGIGTAEPGDGIAAGSGAHGAISEGESPYSGAISGSELLHGGVEIDRPGNQGGREGVSGSALPAGGGRTISRGTRGPSGTGSGMSPLSTKDDDILGILKLLTSLGQTVSGQGGLGPGPIQEELTKLPGHSREMLQKALAAVAAQTPSTKSKGQVLLRLAEHLAIKFALERYERGEVKVNAVRQMIEKMSQEIDGLRKVLGTHEQKLANAGVIVESTAELLDRQFWAGVPERGKLGVLTSPEAWCIPARNVRQFVEQLLQRGDENEASAILRSYAGCLQSEEMEARRRAAIGIADLADLYASLGGRPLAPAIQIAGAQLCLERDENLQGLISAAFVRLAQEAGLKRLFPALVQALDSLDSIEQQRLVLAQSLRPRVGLEKRVPEFLEDVLRGDRDMKGLEVLLQRVPRSSAENLVQRFNRTSNRADMQRLVNLAVSAGDELLASLRDALRSGSANEAAEASSLLSRLDPAAVERWLPARIADWPRQAQDRAVRLVAMGGAPQRGGLLVNVLQMLDPVLLPLAIDEIGLSEDASCIATLLRVAEGNEARSPGLFVRLKAVEALGRLKAEEAAEFLRALAEGRQMFHWTHPPELRLAAVQSLAKIDASWAREFAVRSGFSAKELSLAPLDPLPNAKYFRRRRYPRVRLSEPIAAIATAGQDSYRLEIRGLSLSGGIAVGEKHLTPGTLVAMRIGSGLRPIRAQVLMRDARAQGLGFEFAEMDLDERSRLRKLLLENKPSAFYQEEAGAVQTSA
ncbi:MAG TPA: PilZ domain-containing protein [Candidatus Acidoferrales bacterium]|nr:PilZ domain-containing protein [Candidatus Acidoferrales bacterium]